MQFPRQHPLDYMTSRLRAACPRSGDLMASSISPSASEPYRTALRYVKTLFLQEQYRECIQLCRETLKITVGDVDQNPLQHLYINFYLASSYDAIARVMHHNSVAKLPAFDSAEKHYLEALDGLLTPERVQILCTRQPTEDQSPFLDDQISSGARDSGYYNTSSCRTSSVWISSPPRLGAEVVPDSPMNSPAPTISDPEELESHDSFEEMQTPKRMQRDFSRMSLLDPSLRGNRLSRDVSRMSLIDMMAPQKQQPMSRGLMRPIRLGSPAKTYHLPPTLPYTGTDGQMVSRLPRYLSQTKQKAGNAQATTQQSPDPTEQVSPISRHESKEDYSDSLTLSPVSPQTPTQHHQTAIDSPVSLLDGTEFDQGAFSRINDELEAMRVQFITHIQHVRNAKEQLGRFQAERKAKANLERRKLTIDTSVPPIHASKQSLSSPPPPLAKSPDARPIQQARSYWSFVPEDVKAVEKKSRIGAGRARNWERKRFDPTRYRALCERALAEL